jgi:hypothetical protein
MATPAAGTAAVEPRPLRERAPRYRLACPVQMARLHGVTRDISRSGLLIESEPVPGQPLPATGELLELALQIGMSAARSLHAVGADPLQVQARGRVVRSGRDEAGHWLIAAEFTDLSLAATPI